MMKWRMVASVLVLFGATVGIPAHAATSLEVSGWLPYWRKATSTADTLQHLSAFKEINPFGYSVKTDGTIADTAKMDEDPWPALVAAAKAKKIRVVPTIMWSNGAAIHAILSDGTSRRKLEDDIAALVKEKGYDGIDIDFEGKKAETKQYFATFLKGLAMRMTDKWIMCDIEPRTPVDSRYDGTPPPDATEYANDYAAIGKYCDRVRIMAYDQGTIDVVLTKAQAGKPYVPVADVKWVEKVVKLTAQSIPKRKLVLGVPTYGYEYEVTPLSEQGYRYDLLWAFNQKYAFDLVTQYHPSVQRNSAGELSFSYIPNVFPDTPPPGTESALLTNNGVLPATSGGNARPAGPAFNILWWSDMSAIKDKIALAKKLGLRGIAIFKIDGGEDPALWDVLK